MKMDETKKERFLRVLGKLEKKIILKDPEGEDCEFYVGYPTWRNSDKFWDIIYSVMKIQKEEGKELSKEESISMIKEVSPRIINYIIEYLEIKNKEPLEDEEKDYYYIVLQSNIEVVLNEFLSMATKMFGTTGDVPKNLQAQGPSKID